MPVFSRHLFHDTILTSHDGTICTFDDGEFTFHQRKSHDEHSDENFDEDSNEDSDQDSDEDTDQDSNDDSGLDSDDGFDEDPDRYSGRDFDEGSDLRPNAIFIGESWDNIDGGIGGFIGKKHQYFLYCGEKFPEIAIAWRRDGTGPWEHFTSRRPAYSIPEFQRHKVPIVKPIWSTRCDDLAQVDGVFVLELANNFGHAWRRAGTERTYVQMTVVPDRRRIILTPIEKSEFEELKNKRLDRS